MQQGFIYGYDSENSRWVKVTADSQGRLIINPTFTFDKAGNIYEYWNVQSFDNGSLPKTGAVVLTCPKGWTATILDISVILYTYERPSGGGYVFIKGQNHSTDIGWIRTAAYCIGDLPDFRIRYGYDGDYCCIVIGNTDTKWYRSKIIIERIMAARFDPENWGKGWNIQILDDLTNYSFDTDESINQCCT